MKAEMVLIARSRKTISTKFALHGSRPRLDPKQSGFTLFEILIVVSILAGILTVLVPRVIRTDSDIKKVARHLLVLSKDVRNQARLKNRTFRIAFRMDSDKHGYWVESADGVIPPKTPEQEEEEARLNEDIRPKQDFKKEEKFTKSEYPLGKELYVGSVETAPGTRPITEGMAYVYYTPQGLVQSAAIQLTNRKQLTWTLIINPLTGQVDIVDHALSLRETRRE